MAPLDRRTPPRHIVKGGDQVSFGASGELIFRMLGEKANFLSRIRRDGSGLARISNMPITQKGRVSPDGAWVIVTLSRTSNDVPPQAVAVPVGGGAARKVCSGPCEGSWSTDSKFFYVNSLGPAQRTVVFRLPSGGTLPELPDAGIGFAATWDKVRGGKVIERVMLPGTGDLSTYVFVRRDFRRNLFRIPLR
jgi:hypothetical protein